MLTPLQHSRAVETLRLMIVEMEANPPPMCCANCAQSRDMPNCPLHGVIAPEFQTVPGCPDWVEDIPW